MNIISFKQVSFIYVNNSNTHWCKNISGETPSKRDCGYSIINDVCLIGRNNYYPNVLLYSTNDNIIISPYDEKIMSLNKDCFYENNQYELSNYDVPNNSVNIPVFFFIYNFDNYYHFLYDTIPYLYMFLYLKKIYPDIKLLIQYPNPYMREFYKFNIEIIEKIVDKADIIIHDVNNKYETIFVSTSFTHGGLSNDPPEKYIYNLYNALQPMINTNNQQCNNEYIYISRRTWINKDHSNIGTNYTTRRKMMNEDLLVEELSKFGVKEIFAENLSTDEKIQLFQNAKLVIGSIGGGMSNLLFSSETTRSLIIVTPFFLDINYRFKYSMEHTNITYFNDVQIFSALDNIIPMYCRCKILTGDYIDKVGEIINWRLSDSNINEYLINISKNDIAGFNNTVIFENAWFTEDMFQLLDNGLNSPYVVDIDKLIKNVQLLM